jgi:putative N6-adenine-specific DNA methylase
LNSAGSAGAASRRRIFVVTAPGLEPLTATELAELGIEAADEGGGLAADVTPEQLYRANLHLRTASRILVRVAEFRARTFFELERHAKKVEWGAYVSAGRAVRLRVTSRKSRLYHQRAIEQRLLQAVGAAVPGVSAGTKDGVDAAGGGGEAGDDEEEGSQEQLFIVRFLHDRCTISADTSGALLHLRGYRQALARAPLRETLAAATLLGAGWRGQAPLVDPLCGSGTIPIEAALLARRIPPGLARPDRTSRRFAFQEWPDFDAEGWARVVERGREQILPRTPVRILGSDRDAGAITAAAANAARAGVEEDVELAVRAVSDLPEVGRGGWLVSNPPYGVRVGESQGLRDLYAALGAAARRSLPGGTLALLSADRRLEAQLRVPLREVVGTRNGGIPVRIVKGEVNG